MKRILIDGRFVGVGDSQTRYVLELVKGVLKFDHENSYTLLLRPVGLKDTEKFLNLETHFSNWQEKPKTGKSYQELKTKYSNLNLQILDIKHYSIGEQTKLQKYLKEEKFDLVHFTQFNHPVRYRGKYVITIQDLTLIGHLHRQNILKRLAFKAVMKSAAINSIKIIAISKTTMKDVIDYYNVPKDKFSIIYHGVDHINYNMNVKSRVSEIDKFKTKYNIADDYILYTGMWKRHKNILRMMQAFLLYRTENPDSKIQLVLVGKIDKKEPEVIKEIERINQELAVSSQQPAVKNEINCQPPTANCKPIITTGFIEEEELPLAYAGAFVYCIPSLSEGFGWPPLEAMACGTPVISSRESCMPEILGDAPLYFDAYKVEDIAEKLNIIISDKDLRKNLIKKGLLQVKKYNWEECAKQTFEVYRKLLEKIN